MASEGEAAGRSVESFENAYQGTPTWDIGRPQGAVVRLAQAGLIQGTVLDVGCGTGQHARYLAGLGHRVVGIDFAGTAIRLARDAATDGGLPVRFEVLDALRLAELGRTFDTALDVGLFHCLQSADRAAYAASLASVVRGGGRCFVLCWSDRNPFGVGPQGVRHADLRATFRGDWSVEAIEAERLESRLPAGSVHAWLARLRRR